MWVARDVRDAGGLGVIYWGGDNVGSDVWISPDRWGPGTAWENKAFWDFKYNLHEGIEWMGMRKDCCR